jgi:RimJ/RimL family protein N-acetyltransferase
LLGEQIYTRRLLLRRIREQDLSLIHAWSNSEVAYGPYLTPERLTVRALEDFFAGNTFWNRHNRKFLVENRRTGQAIGTIHYWLKQGQPETSVMCVKIADPGERGQGYGTEAQKYLIIHLFDQMAVKAVEMYTDINNLPQQRCLAKLGFTMVESLTYDDRHVTRTGLLFQLTRADFCGKAIYRFHYE